MDAAFVVVLDARGVRLRAQLELAGGFGFGQFGVEGGPFGAALAAFEAEAELQAARAAVARAAVDGHVAGVHFLVAQARGAVVHDLEVVVAGQAGDAVGARDTHLVLGLAVVGREFAQREGPVLQVGALDVAVDRARAEFVFLEAQRRAGPVRGGAAHGLADPRGQAGEVLGDAPASGGGAFVEPRELAERFPFVVDEAGVGLRAAGFQHHHLDAFLAQLVGQRAAAGAGADDDDDGVVAEVELGHVHVSFVGPGARLGLCPGCVRVVSCPGSAAGSGDCRRRQPMYGGGLAAAGGAGSHLRSWKPRRM